MSYLPFNHTFGLLVFIYSNFCNPLEQVARSCGKTQNFYL